MLTKQFYLIILQVINFLTLSHLSPLSNAQQTILNPSLIEQTFPVNKNVMPIASVTIRTDHENHNANLSQGETMQQILENRLGPQRKPLLFVICMSSVYILIFICGIMGNISTCYVIIYNNCMHTTTNYYLFSLAISDVLSLLTGLPPELYSIIIEAYPWPFGQTFCILKTYIFETTTIASVLTILTFTFERWLHICKAIYAKKFSNGFSRALKIIIFIWTLSGLLALPYSFTSGVYFEYEEFLESKTCGIYPKYKELMTYVIQLSVLFLFIIPMTLISIMYVLIGVTLWKSQLKQSSSYGSANRRFLNKKIITVLFSRQKNNEETTVAKTSMLPMKNSSSVTVASTSHSLNRIPIISVVPGSAINEEEMIYSNMSRRSMDSTVSIQKISGGGGSSVVKFSSNKLTLPRVPSDISMSECSTTNPSIIRMTGGNQVDRTSKEFEHISYGARQSRRDVVKMLFVVVLGFFVCWAPYHSQRVITAYFNPVDSEVMLKLFEYLYYISGISIYISSTINPVLYNVMSKRYRTAFKNTLKMICSCACLSKSRQSSFKSTSFYYKNNNRTNAGHGIIRRNNLSVHASTFTASANSKI